MTEEDISDCIIFDELPQAEDRFTLGDLISTGAQAQIYRAVDKDNETEVVVKIVSHINENLYWIQEEYKTLQKVSGHPSFPKFYGLFLSKNEDKQKLWMAMEYISGGSVAQLVRMMNETNRRLSENIIAYILREIATAVQHLHSMNIMNRDIKGENVLMTPDGKIKLVDFGKSTHVPLFSMKTTATGTPYWMAPEVIECNQKKSGEYDFRCDVWALGITAIELADSKPPLSKIHPMRAMIQIVRNPPPGLRRVSDWTSDFVDFISECLEKNPDHRPHMAEMMEHTFIKDIPDDTSEVQLELLEEVNNCGLMDCSVVREKVSTQVSTRTGYLTFDAHSLPVKMLTDDLATLEIISEEILVDIIYERWNEDNIYTWVADILLFVNPFVEKNIYDANTQMKYNSMSRCDNDPHIFAVADKAHQDMMHNRDHQSIILSGESGSGKTYNYHHLIKHFCYLGLSNPGLIEKIENCSLILDAFGNAMTLLNEDSTRHCRYFDLTFSKTGKLSGAIITMTMLEKMRITSTPKGESNFHILYYFYDGVSQSSRLNSFGLNLGRNYKYLVKYQSDNEVANGQKLRKIEEAFATIGFEVCQIQMIYNILSAILLLGNVDFEGDDENATIVDPDGVLSEVCQLLDIEEKKLTWSLCNFVTCVNKSNLEPRARGKIDARRTKDAFVQSLYSRLVDFIVNTINVNLSITRLVFGDPYAIGILDMFGFEAHEVNSLGNLLVNVANEQLQYFYNQSVFTWEMEDYVEEGIPVKTFSFPNNHHILELFLSKSCGIFCMMENETRGTEGSDEGLIKNLMKLTSTQIKKLSPTIFAITHYVGRVKYDIEGFVEKNREYISAELIQTMRQSKNNILRKLYLSQLTKTGNVVSETADKGPKNLTFKKPDSTGPRRFNTPSKGKLSQTRHIQSVGLTFRYALLDLLYTLTGSAPHFVRCIRSNMDNVGSVFDKDMLRHQLKYHAVSDSIKIRQQGFSYRVQFKEFLRRYQFLAFDFDETVDMTKDNARLMLLRLKMEGWAVGETKVFLKYYNEEYLSRLYEKSVKKIIKIQAMMRTFMMIKRKRREKNRPSSSLSNTVAMEEKEDANLNESSGTPTCERISVQIHSREKFQEPTVEGEAARYLQYYFRKWKLRSLFQTLQIYRADKQQQLILFSQQVHLYAQELQAKMQRQNLLLDLHFVQQQSPESHRKLLKKTKIPTPKLALDHMIDSYFDTSYLCDPSRSKKGRLNKSNEWETPFKNRSAAAIARANNMGAKYFYELVSPPEENVEEPLKQIMDPTSPSPPVPSPPVSASSPPMPPPSPPVPTLSPPMPSVSPPRPLSSPPKPSPIHIDLPVESSVSSPTSLEKTEAQNSHGFLKLALKATPKVAKNNSQNPVTDLPKLSPVIVNDWHSRTHNGYSSLEMSSSNQEPKVNVGQELAIEEMQRRSTESSGSSNGSFNFQGLLRKTNYKRDSMKRGNIPKSILDQIPDPDYPLSSVKQTITKKIAPSVPNVLQSVTKINKMGNSKQDKRDSTDSNDARDVNNKQPYEIVPDSSTATHQQEHQTYSAVIEETDEVML